MRQLEVPRQEVAVHLLLMDVREVHHQVGGQEEVVLTLATRRGPVELGRSGGIELLREERLELRVMQGRPDVRGRSDAEAARSGELAKRSAELGGLGQLLAHLQLRDVELRACIERDVGACRRHDRAAHRQRSFRLTDRYGHRFRRGHDRDREVGLLRRVDGDVLHDVRSGELAQRPPAFARDERDRYARVVLGFGIAARDRTESRRCPSSPRAKPSREWSCRG